MKRPKTVGHRRKIKVGIIGCGTIGCEIAKACQSKFQNRFSLIAVCDIDVKKAYSLQKILKNNVKVLKINELVKKADLIIEAASAKISGEILEKAIKNKKDILIMSVGGILGKEQLLKRAFEKGIRVYIPSGAICGIDGLKAGAIGRIDSLSLTTRKPPSGLLGAPYLKEKKIDLDNITKETIIFDGYAQDAIKGFPQNVNVCAVLSLAGIGGDKTRVKIITSPDYTENIHEVEIRGSFGRIVTRTETVPSKTNPKTSELAILSAIATLKNIANSVRIGT